MTSKKVMLTEETRTDQTRRSRTRVYGPSARVG